MSHNRVANTHSVPSKGVHSVPNILETIEQILSIDPDIRYMALSDLVNWLPRPALRIQQTSMTKLVNHVMGCIRDTNGEVQNLAVQALPLLMMKEQGYTNVVITPLLNYLKSSDGATRDISMTALKYIVHNVPMSQLLLDITKLLVPGLLAEITNFINNNKKDDANAPPTVMPQEAFSVLLDCIQKFTATKSAISKNVSVYYNDITSICLEFLKSEFSVMRKRSISILSIIISRLDDAALDTVMVEILSQLTPEETAIDLRGLESGSYELEVKKTYILLLKAILSSVPEKTGGIIVDMVIQLLSLLTTGQSIVKENTKGLYISDLKQNILSISDGDMNDIDDELRELILGTISTVLKHCEVVVTQKNEKDAIDEKRRSDVTIISLIEPALVYIRDVSMKFIGYDPNYTYEMESPTKSKTKNSEKEDMDIDGDEEMNDEFDAFQDDDDDEADDLSIEFEDDEDYVNIDFSDDEDTSWKVRRAGCKTLFDFILYTPIEFEKILNPIFKFVITRTIEREDTVRIEIIALIVLIIQLSREKQTGSFNIRDATSMEIIGDSPNMNKKPKLMGSKGAESSVNQLSPFVSDLYSISLKLLKSEKAIDELAAITLLKELLNTFVGEMTPYIGEMITLTAKELTDGAVPANGELDVNNLNKTANNTSRISQKIELLELLEVIIRTNSRDAIESFLPLLLAALVTVIDTATYFITSRAIHLSISLVSKSFSHSPNGVPTDFYIKIEKTYGTHILNLVNSSIKVLSSNEENNVKESALVLLVLLMRLTGGDNNSKEMKKGTLSKTILDSSLPEIFKHISNDAISVSALNAFRHVIDSNIQFDGSQIVPAFLETCIPYFKKNIKALRVASLRALEAVFVNMDDILTVLSQYSPKDKSLSTWIFLLITNITYTFEGEDVEVGIIFNTIYAILKKLHTHRNDPGLTDEVNNSIKVIFENFERSPICGLLQGIINHGYTGLTTTYDNIFLDSTDTLSGIFDLLIDFNKSVVVDMCISYILQLSLNHFGQRNEQNRMQTQEQNETSNVALNSSSIGSSAFKIQALDAATFICGIILSVGLSKMESQNLATRKLAQIMDSLKTSKKVNRMDDETVFNGKQLTSFSVYVIVISNTFKYYGQEIDANLNDLVFASFSDYIWSIVKESHKYRISCVNSAATGFGWMVAKYPKQFLPLLLNDGINSAFYRSDDDEDTWTIINTMTFARTLRTSLKLCRDSSIYFIKNKRRELNETKEFKTSFYSESLKSIYNSSQGFDTVFSGSIQQGKEYKLLNTWDSILYLLQEKSKIFEQQSDDMVASTASQEDMDATQQQPVGQTPVTINDSTTNANTKKFTFEESIHGRLLRHELAHLVGSLVSFYPSMFNVEGGRDFMVQFGSNPDSRLKAVAAEATSIAISNWLSGCFIETNNGQVNLELSNDFSRVVATMLTLLADKDVTVQKEALRSVAVVVRDYINGNLISDGSKVLILPIGAKVAELVTVLQRAFPSSSQDPNQYKNIKLLSAFIGIIEQFACLPKPELIQIVRMGPFQHEIDHGLEPRKLAFDLLYLIAGQPELLALLATYHNEHIINQSKSSSGEGQRTGPNKTILERYLQLLKLGAYFDKNEDVKRTSELAILRTKGIFKDPYGSITNGNVTTSINGHSDMPQGTGAILGNRRLSMVQNSLASQQMTNPSTNVQNEETDFAQILYSKLNGIRSTGNVQDGTSVGVTNSGTSTGMIIFVGDNGSKEIDSATVDEILSKDTTSMFEFSATFDRKTPMAFVRADIQSEVQMLSSAHGIVGSILSSVPATAQTATTTK